MHPDKTTGLLPNDQTSHWRYSGFGLGDVKWTTDNVRTWKICYWNEHMLQSAKFVIGEKEISNHSIVRLTEMPGTAQDIVYREITGNTTRNCVAVEINRTLEKLVRFNALPVYLSIIEVFSNKRRTEQ